MTTVEAQRVAFGEHPAQVMDLYGAKTSESPVLVFLHGGGFRRGSPGANGYQGEAYLPLGATFVAMGYRLVPDARFPDSAEDVELGLAWLSDRFSHLVLAGHSAGAMLAAQVALRNGPAEIDGLVLISGFYDFTRQADEIVNRQSPRFVPDLTQAIERVPAHTVVVVGEHDFEHARPNAEAMVAALEAKGGNVEFFEEKNADHFQANRGFISPDGSVYAATRRLLGLG